MGGKTLTTNMDPATDDASSDPQASPVITDIRDQNRKLEKALKDATSRADNAEAAAHAQVKREQEAATLLSMSGLQGLADVVADEVDGKLTEDSVAAWLSDRNLGKADSDTGDDTDASDDGKSSPDQDDDKTAEDVAGVTDLASQVADANQDSDMQNLSRRIDAVEETSSSLDTFAEAVADIVNQ